MILGDELADGHVQLRDLLAGTQRVVAVEDLARELARGRAAPQARVADVPPPPRLPPAVAYDTDARAPESCEIRRP